MRYSHTPLGEEVEFLAGSYHIEREERVPCEGREVLYLLGETSQITTCCGTLAPFRFIKVVGYVVRWQEGANAGGQATSEVEPVRDESVQRRIRESLRRQHPAIDPLHIEFS